MLRGDKEMESTLSKKTSYKELITQSIKSNIRQYTMIIALLSIWAIFALLTDGIFLTSRNLSNLFLQMVTIGLLACGMVLVIVATHIDLSVGSVAGTLGAVAAVLMKSAGLHPVLAIALTLLVGVVVGSWHGYWVAYQGVPAFIVTLASMTAFKGITLALTKGSTIGEFPLGFKAIGQGYVPSILFKEAGFNDTSIIIGIVFICLYLVFEMRSRKSKQLHQLRVLSMPAQVIKMVLMSVVIAIPVFIMTVYRGIPYAVFTTHRYCRFYSHLLLRKTKLGRHIYAIGGNSHAAELSGINNKRVTFLIFVFMGLLTAMASIVFTGRLNAATTSAGSLFELDAIAACYIGGTSSSGGVGTVFGAIIGALVMASLDNGMSLMNVDIMYQYIIKGSILLLAVWIDFQTKKKR